MGCAPHSAPLGSPFNHGRNPIPIATDAELELRHRKMEAAFSSMARVFMLAPSTKPATQARGAVRGEATPSEVVMLKVSFSVQSLTLTSPFLPLSDAYLRRALFGWG